MKLFVAVVTCLTVAGCNNSIGSQPKSQPQPLAQWEGMPVTVLFKRDQLGAAGSPIAPNSTWLNNTKVSLDGSITSSHEQGIFLDSHYKMNSGDTDLRHSIFWIPRDSILAIEKRL